MLRCSLSHVICIQIHTLTCNTCTLLNYVNVFIELLLDIHTYIYIVYIHMPYIAIVVVGITGIAFLTMSSTVGDQQYCSTLYGLAASHAPVGLGGNHPFTI